MMNGSEIVALEDRLGRQDCHPGLFALGAIGALLACIDVAAAGGELLGWIVSFF